MSSAIVQQAIVICGGKAELATRLGVTRQFVDLMLKGVRPIPPGRCIALEAATGGEITRYQIRPDIFGEDPSRVQSNSALAETN